MHGKCFPLSHRSSNDAGLLSNFLGFHNNHYYHLTLRRSLASLSARAKHTLPEMPYDYAALEPVICREIMEIHHSKHHQVSFRITLLTNDIHQDSFSLLYRHTSQTTMPLLNNCKMLSPKTILQKSLPLVRL